MMNKSAHTGSIFGFYLHFTGIFHAIHYAFYRAFTMRFPCILPGYLHDEIPAAKAIIQKNGG